MIRPLSWLAILASLLPGFAVGEPASWKEVAELGEARWRGVGAYEIEYVRRASTRDPGVSSGERWSEQRCHLWVSGLRRRCVVAERLFYKDEAGIVERTVDTLLTEGELAQAFMGSPGMSVRAITPDTRDELLEVASSFIRNPMDHARYVAAPEEGEHGGLTLSSYLSRFPGATIELVWEGDGDRVSVVASIPHDGGAMRGTYTFSRSLGYALVQREHYSHGGELAARETHAYPPGARGIDSFPETIKSERFRYASGGKMVGEDSVEVWEITRFKTGDPDPALFDRSDVVKRFGDASGPRGGLVVESRGDGSAAMGAVRDGAVTPLGSMTAAELGRIRAWKGGPDQLDEGGKPSRVVWARRVLAGAGVGALALALVLWGFTAARRRTDDAGI